MRGPKKGVSSSSNKVQDTRSSLDYDKSVSQKSD